MLVALLAATPIDMNAQGRVKTSKKRKATTERTTQDTKGKTVSGNQSFTVNGVTFTMVAVEGGTFTMGATAEQGSDANDSEKPAHKVTVSSFSIGQTEVTKALWQVVMGSNLSADGDTDLFNTAMDCVSWNDCQTFITKLNELTGKTFRLPTEAEWEYAARGGSKSNGYKYSGSNNLANVAQYFDSSDDPWTVATKSPNELGIYDMSGNVLEWVNDWYGDYSGDAQTNPVGPSAGSGRVVRGGSWVDSAENCRVSHRWECPPDDAGCIDDTYLGLRLAL